MKNTFIFVHRFFEYCKNPCVFAHLRGAMPFRGLMLDIWRSPPRPGTPQASSWVHFGYLFNDFQSILGPKTFHTIFKNLAFRMGHPSKTRILETLLFFMKFFKKSSKSSSRLHHRPEIDFCHFEENSFVRHSAFAELRSRLHESLIFTVEAK